MLVREAESHFWNQLPAGFSLKNGGNYPTVLVKSKNSLLSAIIIEEELRLMGFSSAMVEVDPKVKGDMEEIRFIFDLMYFTQGQFKDCMNLIARTVSCFEKMYNRYAGVTEVIGAFQMKSWGKFLIWALLGVLYIVAGFLTFENPLFAAVLLTLFLGASLLASGAVRLFLAFSMKRESPWVWVALSAVITLLLGLLILARWPVNSVYILGLFLGIDLIMAGAGWVSLGFSLRRRHTS